MRSYLPRSHAVRVEVTKEIIIAACEADSEHCMIADAVKAAVPEAKYVAVDIQTIRFSDPGKGLRYTYLTPRKAQEAILKFDNGDKPSAFTINLSDAQVTAMSHTTKKNTPAQQQKKKAQNKRRWARDQKLRTKQLVAPSDNVNRTDGSIPRVVGGRPPPTAARRREFGLRGFDRDVLSER